MFLNIYHELSSDPEQFLNITQRCLNKFTPELISLLIIKQHGWYIFYDSTEPVLGFKLRYLIYYSPCYLYFITYYFFTPRYYCKTDCEYSDITMLTSIVNYCKCGSDYHKPATVWRIYATGKNGVVKQNNGASVKYCKNSLMHHLRNISAILTRFNGCNNNFYFHYSSGYRIETWKFWFRSSSP